MTATRKILVTAAVLAMTAVYIPASSAQAVSPAASYCFHAFSDTDFSGPDTWLCGSPGACNYVGNNWNDKILSARTENSRVNVELWDNYNCTGGSITVDSSGYHSIGSWVSGYRIELVN